MGTIPTHVIEQVAAANDIVEVIGSYFPLKRAGANFQRALPFSSGEDAVVSRQPGAAIVSLLRLRRGRECFSFCDGLRACRFPRVGEAAGGARGHSGDRRTAAAAARTIASMRRGARFSSCTPKRRNGFKITCSRRELGRPARDYLKKRGITSAVAKSWQLGFAPDSWDACLNWALDRGYERGTILQSGLVKLRDEERPESEVYDRFRGRLMFPICNDVGEVIAFSGRILTNETETAKYLNSPETPLFRKGSILFRSAQNEARTDRSGLRHRLRRPARPDHALRSWPDECRRPAGNRLHRGPGANSETLRQRSRPLFRRRCRRAKGGGALARAAPGK